MKWKNSIYHCPLSFVTTQLLSYRGWEKPWYYHLFSKSVNSNSSLQAFPKKNVYSNGPAFNFTLKFQVFSREVKNYKLLELKFIQKILSYIISWYSHLISTNIFIFMFNKRKIDTTLRVQTIFHEKRKKGENELLQRSIIFFLNLLFLFIFHIIRCIAINDRFTWSSPFGKSTLVSTELLSVKASLF